LFATGVPRLSCIGAGVIQGSSALVYCQLAQPPSDFRLFCDAASLMTCCPSAVQDDWR